MAYFVNNAARLHMPLETAVIGMGQEVIVSCVKELTHYESLQEFTVGKSMTVLKKYFRSKHIKAICDGDIGYNQLDATILYKFFVSECGIDYSDLATDGTLGYFIRKIKDERNEFVHEKVKLTRQIVVSKLEELKHLYGSAILKLGEQRCTQGSKMSSYQDYADEVVKRLDDLRPKITVADIDEELDDLSNDVSKQKTLESSIRILKRLDSFEIDELIKDLTQEKWHAWTSIGFGAAAGGVFAGLFGNPKAWAMFVMVAVGAASASRAINDVVENKNAGKRIVIYAKEVKELLQKIREEGIEELEFDVKLFNIYFDEIESDGGISTGVADYLLATFGSSATTRIIGGLLDTSSAAIIDIRSNERIKAAIEDKLIATLTSTSSSTVLNSAREVGLPLVISIGVAYAFYTSVFEHPSIEKVKKLKSEIRKLIIAMEEHIEN